MPMNDFSDTARDVQALWLHLDLDGELAGAERAQLEEALRRDPALRDERRDLMALDAALAAERIPVRDGFRAAVMAALPESAWTRARRPAWILPLAAMLALALGAVWLLAGSSLGDGPMVGTGLAVADFLQATTLAGAGLLAASWRGLALGLEELFAGSGLGIAALAAAVIFLDLLCLSLLRRRRKARETASTSD